MLYFDYAATTPVDAQVIDAMAPYFTESFYNASALYQGGRKARQAVQKARSQVAQLLGAKPEELLFTSGGTEADNTAIIGGALAARAKDPRRRRVLFSAVEHHAVGESCRFLETLGFEAVELPVDCRGRLPPETLARQVGENTALVSVMWVNNEIGTIQEIPRLAEIAHRAGALFHTDAVQAVGTQPLCFQDSGVDLMSVSAHKIYGPKGCGALAVRTGIEITPLLRGGQQESGRRGGTENVPAIIGFGKAAQLLLERREEDVQRMQERKMRVLSALCGEDVLCNSPLECTAPSILNLAFRDVEAEGMLFCLDREGICLSMGAACNSKSVEPSHVIRAIGLPPAYERGCLRISFGRGQSEEDCDLLTEKILRFCAILRR